jgi:hypothetical protein
VIEVALGLVGVGLLIFLAATTGPDRRNSFAEHPLMLLTWAVVIAVLGGLILVERTHYVSVYDRGINWGPFKMGIPAISRLVVATGILLVIVAIVIALIAFRRVVTLYGF